MNPAQPDRAPAAPLFIGAARAEDCDDAAGVELDSVPSSSPGARAWRLTCLFCSGHDITVTATDAGVLVVDVHIIAGVPVAGGVAVGSERTFRRLREERPELEGVLDEAWAHHLALAAARPS